MLEREGHVRIKGRDIIMNKRLRPDDDLRNTPPVKSSIPGIDSRLTFYRDHTGDRVIVKLDKAQPEIPIAVKALRLEDNSSVVILGAQGGVLGVSLAALNPRTDFFLYDSNVVSRKVAQRNITANYAVSSKVKNITDEELEVMTDNSAVDAVILNPGSFTSMELIDDLLRTARQVLKKGGKLYLISHKKTGSSRGGESLEALFDQVDIIARGGGGFRIFEAIKKEDIDRSQETSLRKKINFSILGNNFEVETEPSLFSKDNLDIGTRILLENVDLNKFHNLLDVGCGWGAIGIVAATRNQTGRVVMTDVDTRAVRLAQSNISRLGLNSRVQVLATDNLRVIDQAFDLALSNPPFHEKYGVLLDIFKQVKDKLSKNGQFYIVVEKTFLNKIPDALNEAFSNSRIEFHDEKNGFYILSTRK